MKFLDNITIQIKAGNGGNGSASFRREKFIEFGGPDGGDGGRGGHVIFEAADNINTLIDFQFHNIYKAENGKDGKGRQKYGEGGKDLILRVPVGSIISSNGTELFNFTQSGIRFIAAHGGRGGYGNMHFKTSTNRAPERFGLGEETEIIPITLELKLIADVGIIGLPNAGKTSLLAAITNAKPKIADYPFTTITPNLGVYADLEHFITFADIPGLIEGASFGTGLGHKFLSHIERCKILLHVLDASSSSIEDDYKTLNTELSVYKDGILSDKPITIVLNKIDLLEDDKIVSLQAIFSKYNHNVLCISTVIRNNLDSLVEYCCKNITL